MAFSHEFQRYRSVHPRQMLQGLVISILLHSTLLIGSKYWLRAFMPEPKQEIPIEVVEVYPNETHIPQKTLFRAIKDSIAGGKALPKKPVSAVKSANVDVHKASSKSPFELTALSPAKVFQPEPRQQKAESANLSPQQPKPRKTAMSTRGYANANAPATIPPTPKPKKIAVAPNTIPLAAKPQKTAMSTTRFAEVPATIPPAAKPKKIAVAPNTIPLAAKPQKTAMPTTGFAEAPATIPPAPKLKKIVVVPNTIPLAAKPQKTAMSTTGNSTRGYANAEAPATIPPAAKPKKIAVASNTTPPVGNPKNLVPPGTRLSGRTPSQAQSSVKTGAASLLGGTLGVSSRNFSGDYLAGLPNSNRDRQATSGIDASSQNIDITSYLNQLQQRVKQQWLPEVSQSSRRTVLNFTVNRSGQLSNLQLAETSGFSLTDKAALNAIQRAAPFAPLPTGYTSNHIDIQFTFNINVYGQLNLSGDGG